MTEVTRARLFTRPDSEATEEESMCVLTPYNRTRSRAASYCLSAANQSEKSRLQGNRMPPPSGGKPLALGSNPTSSAARLLLTISSGFSGKQMGVIQQGLIKFEPRHAPVLNFLHDFFHSVRQRFRKWPRLADVLYHSLTY